MAELNDYYRLMAKDTDSDDWDTEVVECKLGTPQPFDKVKFIKQMKRDQRQYEKFLKRERNELFRKFFNGKLYVIFNALFMPLFGRPIGWRVVKKDENIEYLDWSHHINDFVPWCLIGLESRLSPHGNVYRCTQTGKYIYAPNGRVCYNIDRIKNWVHVYQSKENAH